MQQQQQQQQQENNKDSNSKVVDDDVTVPTSGCERIVVNIDGIGETQVNSLKIFFSNEMNLKVLNELEKILTINNTVSERKNGLLKDKTFLVTGKLNEISRAEVKSLIEENSGSTVSSVSKKLNYLIIGDKPTKKKVENAKELKIKIIDQNQFLKMLNKTS